jgi:hypothetical protein
MDANLYAIDEVQTNGTDQDKAKPRVFLFERYAADWSSLDAPQ